MVGTPVDECGSDAADGERADLAVPFVLVGESFGVPVVRRFAILNPTQVVGVVLVDAAEEGVAFGTLMNEFVDANERTGRAREPQACARRNP